MRVEISGLVLTIAAYYTVCMRPAFPDLSSADASASPTTAEHHRPASVEESPPDQTYNFVVMVLYQVVVRVGWIFKTESVIMPAVLDSIGGAGWLRGCLPLLNRFGQSVPPLLSARRIKIARRKKKALAICTCLMSMSFVLLSVIWLITGGRTTWWMPVVFLTCYAVFFMSNGVNQLTFGTIQGKLIRVNRRGRLLLVASVIGGVCAVTAALCLLPFWLRRDGTGEFGLVFGFTGICFAISAVLALFLKEPADNYEQPPHPLVEHFTNAARTIRDDMNFRRLAIIAALFGTSMMLFPHYQALGRERLSLTLDNLIWYVVVQNVGVALFSLPAGELADRFGNRLVLRLGLLAICGGPIAALVLAHTESLGPSIYFLVFLLVGLTPITIKTLNNYTLEICEPADHPRYLSTLSLCLAAPVFLSPLVGLLVDLFAFEPVFLAITAIVFVGWLLSFGLCEPRHHPVMPPDTTTMTGE